MTRLAVLQARSTRPARELTNDNVQLHLATQQDLLTNFVHKLERALSVAARAAGKLAAAHAALTADAGDKVRSAMMRYGVRTCSMHTWCLLLLGGWTICHYRGS